MSNKNSSDRTVGWTEQKYNFNFGVLTHFDEINQRVTLLCQECYSPVIHVEASDVVTILLQAKYSVYLLCQECMINHFEPKTEGGCAPQELCQLCGEEIFEGDEDFVEYLALGTGDRFVLRLHKDCGESLMDTGKFVWKTPC